MQDKKKCARCDSSVFYCIDTVESPNYEFANSFKPLGLTGDYGDTGETGFLGGAKQGRQVVRMTAWVCKACGFTDLYAKDRDLLEKLVSTGKVRIVGG